MALDFQHKQSAHCENGAVSNLLNFHGLSISEPMVFGIGSGLFFSHMPFIKLDGIPVTSYRTLPGHVFKRLTKRLGIKMKSQTFRSEKKAMDELDRLLAQGLPVGLLTSVFYLPYLPKAFRFHFNAHNIVIFGKKKGKYLVSDSVMDYTTEIEYDDLVRARFAKGTAPPKGKMYYPVSVPDNIDFKAAIRKGIKNTASDMLNVPLPFFGLRGIKYLSKKIKKYPEKLGKRKARQYIGNIIRMQEEIGTGGAGFRFIFAAFLQEAAKILQEESLIEIAWEMTENGDRWRDFAFMAGRICKGRNTEEESYDVLAEILLDCQAKEREIFKALVKI